MENILPPVAKSVHTPCRKCGVDRYHRVLAHTSSTSAKVECEVCHSKKTFSIATSGKSTAVKKSTSGSGPKISKGLLKHQEEYAEALQNLSGQPEFPFSIREKFSANQKLRHSKFGLGVVKTIFSEKIEVLFADELKTLVHNRT